ncbi:putative flippase GtrA [Albidovulum inexpectatum]|uniref:Putative flippase GtrA n=1 Tax=Albidovulum inexpectatum TaxID=196587 RepID=A0A2S5JJJ7_9RHOB|nr:GtrA family protein [Albidovulum inexpectatum]PPB81571.1 putative flippase GtrA [Albidovulum inexpectatum]
MSGLSGRSDLGRLVRFLLVGVVNTAFGFGVYALLIWLALAPQLALALSWCLGVLWNFGTHARLVFDTTGLDRLPFYVASYGAIYVVNAGCLSALLALGLHPIAAQAVLVLPIAVLAYLLVSFALTGRLPFVTRRGRDEFS